MGCGASPKEHMQRVIDQGDRRPMARRSREAMRELKDILLKSRETVLCRTPSLGYVGRTADQSFQELRDLMVRG